MTRGEAETLAIKLGCCTWDQGNDGFGGEWEAHEKAVKILLNVPSLKQVQKLAEAAHMAGIALKASALGLLAHGQKELAMELNEKADAAMSAAEEIRPNEKPES